MKRQKAAPKTKRATKKPKLQRQGAYYGDDLTTFYSKRGRGGELQFYDTTLAETAIAQTAALTGGEYDPSATSMISTPAQGAGEQNRIGKQIICKSVIVKGTVDFPSGEDKINPPEGGSVFVALVLDTQTNGAQMNSEDCFKNLSNSLQGCSAPLRNLLFGKRFKVLKSGVYDFSAKTLTATAANAFAYAGHQANFDWFVPLNNLPINFNSGTTASVANVIDNSLHMIAFCDGSIISPTLTYNARLRFFD